MKSKLYLHAAVGGLALLSASVQAAMIPAFNFETASGWLADGSAFTRTTGQIAWNDCDAGATDAQNNCGLTFSGNQEVTDGYTTVDWYGNNDVGPSGLDIESYDGNLVTNGGWVDTGMITHRNRLLPTPATTLKMLNLISTFQLTNPIALGPTPGAFGIEFTETTNSDPCPAPNPLGSICDDFFTLSGLPSPISFIVDGYVYTITFRMADADGFALEDNILYTREGADNSLKVQAQITAREVTVPEPATLGILGLGLLLLNRRKFIAK